MPTVWITLIAQYGIPAAYQIWQDWRNKQEPTDEDWQKLLALSRKTTADYEAEVVVPITVAKPA